MNMKTLSSFYNFEIGNRNLKDKVTGEKFEVVVRITEMGKHLE